MAGPGTSASSPAPPSPPSPPSAWNDRAFRAFRFSFGSVLRVWFRLRVEGSLPATGPCVVAANHTSLLDPIVLGAASRRRIVYLMTELMWRSPALGWFYRWNHAIPIGVRGGNRDAMRAARSVLQQGRVLGVFPEGGISRDGLPMLGNPGAVALVLQENVPIVPVGVVGTHAAMPYGATWPRPAAVTVRFGTPILAAELDRLGGGDRRARLREATALIMRRIAALTGTASREDELAPG